ncbi:site-specific integrase [Pedobacter insulae]|uniref:Site-specific recombinase XerD n=1 Tax=Pedobacter insulae TaxID=414048 RepID=A0A1I2UV62_9SPHI|nr:site-specific integrase [Pedobacter insulae]SFG80069.1 Site-specific recombinase XerD [Pedobacter insulae]
MKTQHTFTTLFFLKKDKQTNGNAPLYAKITVNGQFTHLSAKRRLAISDWNQKQQKISGDSDHQNDVREKMRTLSGEINQAYDEIRYAKQPLTAEAIKAKVEGTDEQQHSLKDLLDYHNQELGKLLSEGTMKNYYTSERFLYEFLQAKRKKKNLILAQLDYKFITDFGLFLRLRTPDKGQRPCTNNTVMKHMERLKKLIGIAIKNNWMSHDPFENFKRHMVKRDRESLDEQELQRFANAIVFAPGHLIVQDMFLFSCYTGLGYAEVCRFNLSHLSRDKDGNMWLEMTRKKTFSTTEQKFQVLLLPEALELIEKYQNHPVSLQGGVVFPFYSNQVTNRYIKLIVQAAKIEKKVSFHTARHTFATTITLENGISIESVAHMLGHASIRTTQIYAKVRMKKVANEMLALQSKMHPRVKMVG